MRRTLPLLALLCVTAACASARRPAPLVLPRPPYVGLACRHPSLACRRLGLAVWTPWRARRVTAEVRGRRLVLWTRPGRGAYARGRFWQVFFRDPEDAAKAQRYPAVLRLEVRAVDGRGVEHATAAETVVSQGYG